jgi:hypothetical protein
VRSVGRTLAVLVLATVTGCGSTVQQQTLQTAGAPVGSDGLGSGLEVPGGEPAGPLDGDAGNPSGGDTDPSPVDPSSTDSTAAGAVPSIVSGSTDAAEPGAPAAPTTPGATNSSPLKLGLLYVNNDAAAGAGVDNGTTFGPRRVLEALVAATNARGGLAGRRIVPTYVEIQSSSSSIAAELQAACSSFAEDAKVGVVMSYLGLAEEQFSTCLAKSGIVHLNGSYGLGDVQSIAAQPLTASPNALGADRRLKALLERMKSVGHLTGTSRIGVLVEGCPYNTRATERTLVPTAKQLGLNVVRIRTTRCFGGINDLSGLASDSQGAVLDFNSQQVDRVVFVSAVEGNVMLVFATAAESQGYRPGYALSSLVIPNVIQDNVPQGQLTGAKGMGWLPPLDDDADLTPTPAADACIAALKSQGLSPATRSDHWFAYAPCDTFALADRVLKQTSGSAAADRWNSGLNAVGAGFAGAAMVDGRTDFRDGRRDGAARARTFAWNVGCSCFRYTGSSYPI